MVVVGKAPEVCLYCKGSGLAAVGNCGFCLEGKPLDTQEDWDASWGKLFEDLFRPSDKSTKRPSILDDLWKGNNRNA